MRALAVCWRKPLAPACDDRSAVAPRSSHSGSTGNHPVTASQKLIPQGQVYLVPVDFDDADEAVCTNTQAQVKIHCNYRSAAWWVYRTVSSVFDLGLL